MFLLAAFRGMAGSRNASLRKCPKDAADPEIYRIPSKVPATVTPKSPPQNCTPQEWSQSLTNPWNNKPIERPGAQLLSQSGHHSPSKIAGASTGNTSPLGPTSGGWRVKQRHQFPPSIDHQLWKHGWAPRVSGNWCTAGETKSTAVRLRMLGCVKSNGRHRQTSPDRKTDGRQNLTGPNPGASPARAQGWFWQPAWVWKLAALPALWPPQRRTKI